jgi:hypothetical protein
VFSWALARSSNKTIVEFVKEMAAKGSFHDWMIKRPRAGPGAAVRRACIGRQTRVLMALKMLPQRHLAIAKT